MIEAHLIFWTIGNIIWTVTILVSARELGKERDKLSD